MAIDRNAEEHNRLMESSRKATEAIVAQNQRANQQKEEEKSPSKSSGGSGKSGGKSGGGQSGDKGLADAMQAGRDGFHGGAIPAFPGSAGSPLVMSNAHQLVMNELIQRGVRPEVAAGAVGSLMGESGNRLNPRAYNPNDNGGPSGGIAQWHDGHDSKRLTNLYNFAGTNDINKIPLETQVKFLGHELDTSHKRVLDGLLQGRTVADGVNIWTRSYEVPANVDHQVELRMKQAENLWSGYQNSQNNSAGNDYTRGLADHYAGKANGESGECVALVKQATGVGHTSNWQPGGSIGANTPVGTPIATFGADGVYKNKPGESHAAIYLGPGSQPGSIKVLDQWNNHPAGVREIHPGDKAESAQNFRTIATRDGSDPGLAKAPGVTPQQVASAIPTNASVHMDDRAMPANARTYMDAADVRGNPREGQTVNIKDLESYDMAKAKGNVRAQDPGALENARNQPQRNMVDAPRPPERPAILDIPRNDGAPAVPAAGMPNAQHTTNAPLPPERPAALDIPRIDNGQTTSAASVPNPTVNAPLPPTRPDHIDPAVSGPQQHANMGPPDPNAPAPLPPERPADLIKPREAETAVPLPPASNDRPETASAAPPSVAPTQQPQQASDDPFGGFASWLGSLFDNPDNLNEAQQQPPVAQQSGSEMPVQDVSGGDNFDFGGGGDLFSAIGSFFGGFENGGPVGSFARGGLVRKANGGRPDRTANAQPGVAVPTGYRNTDPGGGYSARRSVTPGYARGGPVEDGTSLDGAVDLGGGSAPAPQVEAPAETSSAPLVSRGAIPTEGFGDEAPIIGPNSVEAKQQAALEKYAEQRAISQQMHQPKNLRELLMSAATDVVHNVQSDYGIDRAVQRQQGQAVPTGEDKDPISAFFDMLTGAPQEAAPPEKVKALGDVVDPSNRLTEGMRTTAGMAAGVEYLLNKGDYKGAQEMARSVMFHQQLQAAKYGDQAVELLRQGKNEQAVQTMVKGQDQIPDGTTVKAKSTPDGGAIVTQKDENGKVMGHHRLNEAQLMGMALGLKDGTAYWQSIVHLANGDKGEMPHSEAYQQYQQRALPPAPTPQDPNSPQYKLHQEALSVVGAMPELPANFQQMSPTEQKEVLAGVREQRQAWTPQYSQYMQGGRQERGFDYRTENREDNQKFRTDERVAGQEYHTGERIAGQEYRTGERVAKEEAAANKPLKTGERLKVAESITTAFDEAMSSFKGKISPEDRQRVESTAAQLFSANPSLSPTDAIRAGVSLTSGSMKSEEKDGRRVSKLSDGRVILIPNGLGGVTAAPAQ